MNLFDRFKSFARRFRSKEDGSSTIEFVIIFPMFAYMMMGGYEIGYYTVTSSMLDQGLDRAVRDVRLGRNSDVTLDTMKRATCTYARYVRNCEENIHITMEPLDAAAFTRPDEVAVCIDRGAELAPLVNFQMGGENELMLVRVCVNVDPIFPTTWLGQAIQSTEGSGYAIVSTAAFVNEPNI